MGRSPFLIDQAQEPTPHQTTFLLPIQTDHCSTVPPFASYSASHRNPLWRAVCASASQAGTCHPLPPSVPVSSPTQQKVSTDQEFRFRRTFVAVADSRPPNIPQPSGGFLGQILCFDYLHHFSARVHAIRGVTSLTSWTRKGTQNARGQFDSTGLTPKGPWAGLHEGLDQFLGEACHRIEILAKESTRV